MAALRSGALFAAFSERFLSKYTSIWLGRPTYRLLSSLVYPFSTQGRIPHAQQFHFTTQKLNQKRLTSEGGGVTAFESIRKMHSTSNKSDEKSPEFVSERISITYAQNMGVLDGILRKARSKTGVLIKVLRNQDDNSNRYTLLIGGSRQDVKRGVDYLKSLLAAAEAQTQSSLKAVSPTEKPKERHFGDKEKLIWSYYRRNFKGQKPPVRTRKRCIRGKGEKQTVSGNPCALCRLYLGGGYQLDYKDIHLLSQFISPHNGEVFEASKTGLCRVQQEKLVEAIETAKDYGLLPYSIPGPRSLEKPPQTAQIPINVRLK